MHLRMPNLIFSFSLTRGIHTLVISFKFLYFNPYPYGVRLPPIPLRWGNNLPYLNADREEVWFWCFKSSSELVSWSSYILRCQFLMSGAETVSILACHETNFWPHKLRGGGKWNWNGVSGGHVFQSHFQNYLSRIFPNSKISTWKHNIDYAPNHICPIYCE